ncbi:hypothetical protein [Archangium sp.]|uniref:hypothetical protein n=1 Tax=Archangium sp. TaxID=1872627 RepID=UPI00286B2556|nr:hypothetical protein [Archangium sp.]
MVQPFFAPVFQSFRDIVGEEIARRAFSDADAEQARLLETLCGTGGDPSHAPARRAYEKVGFGPAIPSVSLYRLL